MKAFLAAVAFVALAMVVTGIVFERVSYTSTEAYSEESARVGQENPVDGRLGWSPDI